MAITITTSVRRSLWPFAKKKKKTIDWEKGRGSSSSDFLLSTTGRKEKRNRQTVWRVFKSVLPNRRLGFDRRSIRPIVRPPALLDDADFPGETLARNGNERKERKSVADSRQRRARRNGNDSEFPGAGALSVRTEYVTRWFERIETAGR